MPAPFRDGETLAREQATQLDEERRRLFAEIGAISNDSRRLRRTQRRRALEALKSPLGVVLLMVAMALGFAAAPVVLRFRAELELRHARRACGGPT